MSNSIKSNTTFWTEISEYIILVPDYQRDYAQGRIDGGRIDNIRKVFVEELYRAINVTEKGEEKRTCHLGLVFGSYDEDKTTFIAVDGQQRLTTVFLFYWYVAWREGKLSDFKVLSTNFSWETRSYSSLFVDLLFKINQANNVIEAIKSNSDYFSIWENDPTVKGMLTMLEEIESQYPRYECNLSYNLFSNDCNIRYDILRLEKDSDSKTYIKMNSRGRSLTTFELFKSKFIDYYKPSFAKQFDEEWLTFMLEMSRDETGGFVEPDISYMNLINEYTYLMLMSKDIGNTKRYDDFIAAKLKDNHNLMDIPFISFERYKIAFDGNTEYFEKFFNWIIANYETIDRIDGELRFPGSKFFLKEIIKSNNPNYSDRTKLYSIFKYSQLINYAKIEDELFKKWNRVFSNLVENTDIDSSNFGNICKAIDRINNRNIYSYLISDSNQLTYFDKAQVKEEIAKAKQILAEDGLIRKYDGLCKNKDGESFNTWEDVITEAEQFAFFKGAISFLFQNEKGEICWRNFDSKFNRAKTIFCEKGINDECLEETLTCLYSYCDNWGTQLWWSHKIFNGQLTTWKKNILTFVDESCNYVYALPVHHILMGDPPKTVIEDSRIKKLANRSLVSYLLKQNDNKRDMYIRSPHDALYFYRDKQGVMLSNDFRDASMSKILKDEHFSLRNPEIQIPDTNLLWGFDINFICMLDGQPFNLQWYRERNNQTYDIYLMDEDWNYMKRHIELTNAIGDKRSYYCFNLEENNDVAEQIMNWIKKLCSTFGQLC